MIRWIWKHFLTGLLVVLPAVVTLAIVRLFLGWLDSIFLFPVTQAVGLILPKGAQLQILSRLLIVIGFVGMVALIGFATRVLMIRQLMDWLEAFLRRVPILGTIYWTVREIAQMFAGTRKGIFTRVVLVEWPRPGLYVVGFVTSEGKTEVQQKTASHLVHVFIPTTPNPTSGYLVLAPEDSLIDLEMSVEDGIRLIVSGGTVGPKVWVG